MQQPETLSDFINFVSFGQLFCQDLDLAILLHQDVHLAQTEWYQMDFGHPSELPRASRIYCSAVGLRYTAVGLRYTAVGLRYTAVGLQYTVPA